jgi:hypothetical protein
MLERDEPAAENPSPRGEPDRRVAAGTADLEHLDSRLRRRECEEEASRARGDLPRPLLGRDARIALRPVFLFEPSEN